MDPTSSEPMIFSHLDDKSFHPLRDGRNPHRQTLLPRLVRQRITLQPHWQRLTLPDSDFVDLAWSEDPALVSANIEYPLTRYGGHVGFVSGTLCQPQMWLAQRIPQWLSTWLEP